MAPATFVGCFSLVAFLPEPMASFVDALRTRLEPGCNVRGHLTLLPPRRLCTGATADQAWEEVQMMLQHRQPFLVELDEVSLFTASGVIHLSVARGAAELDRLHSSLASGCFGAEERYIYEPHVTLAHLGPVPNLQDALAIATDRWAAYQGPRTFMLDHLTFVRCTAEQCWQNLHDYHLQAQVPVPV